VPDKTRGPIRPEITRFKTYYSVPDNLPELDSRLTALVESFVSVPRNSVLGLLARLVARIADCVERSIYDPWIGCAIYRKACQVLSERDIDPWELALGDPVAEALHHDAYDGLPGIDESDPFTSLALIKLLARAVVEREAVIQEMISGVFHSYSRERVAMAGLLQDARFVPYLENLLEGWNHPHPPRQALGALGQIATREAVSLIAGWLRGNDETTVAAVEALEQAGTPEALEALRNFRQQGEYPPELDVAVANIREGLEGLVRMAQSSNPLIRAGALDRLGGLKDPHAVRILGEALDDKSSAGVHEDGRDYTIAEVACAALNYYGRAYLRRYLSDKAFDKYNKLTREMRKRDAGADPMF